MTRGSNADGVSRSVRRRRWLVRLAVTALVVEIVYLVAANALLQTGLIFSVINKRPERVPGLRSPWPNTISRPWVKARAPIPRAAWAAVLLS